MSKKKRKGFFNRAHSTTDNKFSQAVNSDAAFTAESSISSEGGAAPNVTSHSGSSSSGSTASVNVVYATKIPLVPEKNPSVQFSLSEDMEVEDMEVDPDPDPDGLESTGTCIADLNTDDTVWMVDVPDTPLFDMQVGAKLEETSINIDNVNSGSVEDVDDNYVVDAHNM